MEWSAVSLDRQRGLSSEDAKLLTQFRFQATDSLAIPTSQRDSLPIR